MKKFAIATIIISVVLLNSCGESAATFDKPQPENVESLAFFPKHLRGKYLADDQASIMTITDKLIIMHYEFDEKEHKDSLGSSYKIIGDTLINLTDGMKARIFLNGDTIMRISWMDTLFNISAYDVLKKLKGYYFLNNHHVDSAWKVKKLSLKKGVLTVGRISDKEDIQKLKEIGETAADTTSTHFSLTGRQFKRFLRKDGFSEQETFNRIAENYR